MINQDIAGIFFEMADILELQNVQWKPRAYRQAARAIDGLEEDVSVIYKKGGLKLLEQIPGVGEHIAGKIVEFIETGKVRAFDKLKRSVSSHVMVLVKVPGMGPKKLKKLNQVLNIRTIAQLEKACRQHKVARLPGFGEKSEQDILDGIVLFRKSKGRIPLKKAHVIAGRVIGFLKKNRFVRRISVAGSLRREKSLIRDIDILVSSTKPANVIDFFVSFPNQKVLAKGPTKATIVLKDGFQVDLRVLPPESWGAGLFYFTGSKNYNIEMRRVAIKKGFKLSEYGLFDKQSGEMVAGRSEKDICEKLGVPFLRPEDRER